LIIRRTELVEKDYTFTEILNQPKALKAAYYDIIDRDAGADFLKNPYDELILFGCGTDYNLCQSAVFFSKSLTKDKSFQALPSSELLLNPETYINKDKRYLLVGFSRSGETTESIDIVKKFKNSPNINTFIFTARGDSAIVKLADSSFISKESLEKSIAMTQAYTCFLFSYCLILAKILNRKDIVSEFKDLADFLNSNIDKLFAEIRSYADTASFRKCFVLGSGFNYGIAVEADLKMKEMALVESYSYHLHEFIHGPKTLVDNESLCLILTLDKGSPASKDVLKELLGYGSKLLTVDCKDLLKDENGSIYNIINNPGFKIDMVRSFLNIPVFQILAYSKAIGKGLNPDKPRNLNYTTKLNI
jgi:glucosamine--fructose-6-phosphate aminotransferase (isomerizing)